MVKAAFPRACLGRHKQERDLANHWFLWACFYGGTLQQLERYKRYRSLVPATRSATILKTVDELRESVVGTSDFLTSEGTSLRAVPWLRRLAAGLPLRRPGCDPGANPGWSCGGQSSSGTGFSHTTSVSPCQFYSTVAPLLAKGQKLSFSLSSQVCTRSLKAAVRPSVCCGGHSPLKKCCPRRSALSLYSQRCYVFSEN
jgi:hypothetical protein